VIPVRLNSRNWVEGDRTLAWQIPGKPARINSLSNSAICAIMPNTSRPAGSIAPVTVHPNSFEQTVW
jgi:hypothetical protein